VLVEEDEWVKVSDSGTQHLCSHPSERRVFFFFCAGLADTDRDVRGFMHV